MGTTTKWIVPCYFTTDASHNIVIDITDTAKTIIKNKVWERKYKYHDGSIQLLQNITPEDILQAKVEIFPKYPNGAGVRFANELSQHVETQCEEKIHSYFKTNNYKDWNNTLGVATISVDLNYSRFKTIPTKTQIQNDDFKDFIDDCRLHTALLKELAYFFLAAVHLTFPSKSIMGWNENHINDGIFYIASGRRRYINPLKTDAYTHEVLINQGGIQRLNTNLHHLSKNWHFNLWSLRRFLVSVHSNRVNMDNLLDLMYALEGLFDKNVSSDFIKVFVFTRLSNQDKKKAKNLKSLLDTCFKMRNEMVHAGRYYDADEEIKLAGETVPADDIYWKMKEVVAVMIILAIAKLNTQKNAGMKNLKFGNDDLFDSIFP